MALNSRSTRRSPEGSWSGDRASDRAPAFPAHDVPDHVSGYTVTLGQQRERRACCCVYPDLDHGCFGELCCPVSLPFSVVSEDLNGVEAVLGRSHPLQVLESVVDDVAVFMVGLVLWRRRLIAESTEYEARDGEACCARFVIASQPDREVAVGSQGLFQQGSLPNVSAVLVDPDSTEVRDRVDSFVSWDDSPLFHGNVKPTTKELAPWL